MAREPAPLRPRAFNTAKLEKAHAGPWDADLARRCINLLDEAQQAEVQVVQAVLLVGQVLDP